MSDTTPPARTTLGTRIAHAYDAAQITKCHNLFDVAAIPIALGLAWLFRAVHG